MHRRDFVRAGLPSAFLGPGAVFPTDSAHTAEKQASPSQTSGILKDYTGEDHRRRLANIQICHGVIRSCMRQHLVTNYLPGQCCYDLGEYPCRRPGCH